MRVFYGSFFKLILVVDEVYPVSVENVNSHIIKYPYIIITGILTTSKSYDKFKIVIDIMGIKVCQKEI